MFHQLPLDSLSAFINRRRVCIVLDTARPSAEQWFSLVFTDPAQILVCRTIDAIPRFLETISELSKHRWIAGFLSYEAAYGLEKRFLGFTGGRCQNDLAWFGVFNEPHIFDHQTGTWNRDPLLAQTLGGRNINALRPDAPPVKLRHTLAYKDYSRAIQKIRRFIAAGDVYQVNYTYDLTVSSPLRAWELYLDLRKKQPVAFGAFIKTGTTTVASLSPELFFMKNGNRVITRPMKGTARRGRYSGEDAKLSAALAADPKNCSENVMIVDLLRNDLGKICKTGTVETRSLFDVERHPTVLQMTSTVEGVLKDTATLSSIFRALFPCGSVTGAPKIRAMEIIRSLEQGDRGVYCGAIGYSSPAGRSVFSVPIRTLERKMENTRWRYRVGSGIVWDSRADGEWRECRDKCRFLTVKAPEFRLFESILFDKQRLLYCSDHKKRIFDAADYFGFSASEKEWDMTVRAVVGELRKQRSQHKVRILVDKTGAFAWESEPIPATSLPENFTVRMARKPIATDTPFLFHKTTVRPWYRHAMDAIRKGNCFDMLHCNTEGQLTEGARSNLFVSIEGRLYTPPVECGLLPGVLRGRLLRAGKCKERELKRGDLRRAEAVYCGNSVRGLIKVTIIV